MENMNVSTNSFPQLTPNQRIVMSCFWRDNTPLTVPAIREKTNYSIATSALYKIVDKLEQVGFLECPTVSKVKNHYARSFRALITSEEYHLHFWSESYQTPTDEETIKLFTVCLSQNGRSKEENMEILKSVISWQEEQ